MKGAIASVDLFAIPASGGPAGTGAASDASESPAARRLTLTVTAPERADGASEAGGALAEGAVWQARVALADLHRPVTVAAADSVSALARALAQAAAWLTALEAQGLRLHRDRAGTRPFVLAEGFALAAAQIDR